MRKLTLFLACALSVLLTSAAIITGTVHSPSGEPSIGATVRLLSMPDSVYSGGAATDLDGFYRIDSVSPGRYILLAHEVGSESAPVTVQIKSQEDSLEVPAIRLGENVTTLKELQVQGTKVSVTAKGDTLEYNAGSYKTQQNAVVEDLLKKLPGVEVGQDGSITSGGKTVSKILVDGEEFFSDDPKMASKNLPADIVDKVQVLDSKSDLAKLTGVDDGEEQTVINLTIKKGMKNGWFGKVMAGYGTDKRYNFGFNISHFRDNNQLTILGATNNVNDMTFTDQGRGRFRDFGGNDGITTARSLGLNFSVGRSEKLRVGGNVLYTYSDQDYRKKSETQYIFPDSVSYQTQESKSRVKGHNVRSDFRLQWQIDDSNTLDFRPRFSFNSRSSFKSDESETAAGDAARTKVNSQDNFQQSKGTSWEASGDLIYSHKFASRAGRSLSFQGKYNFSDTREKGRSWSDITYYLLQDDSERLYRYLDSHQWSNTAEGRLTWVEPLGDPARGNFLNIAYHLRYSWNDADKLTYNLPQDAPAFEERMTEEVFRSLSASASDGVLDVDLSNRFRNAYFTQDLQVSYKKVASAYNLEAGLVFSPSMSKSEDLMNSLRNIPARWVYNYAPFLRFRYKFGERSNFDINYRARTTAPTLTQLQPVADESDPLNITVGNPDLKPTFTQTLMARVMDYNIPTQRMLMAMLHLQHTTNGIVNRTTTDPVTGAHTTTYANVSNGFMGMGMFMYNQQIPSTKLRVSAELFANYSNSPGYMNGELNRASNLSLSPRLGLTYSLDIFQITARPNYSVQYTHNSLGGNNRTVHSFGVNADAGLYLPFGLEVSTDIDWTKTSGYAQGYNSSQALWNAQVSYSFLSGKSLTLALKVYDILQQKRAITRSVTATAITDQQVNALTRYAMVTLTWNFQTFKGKASVQSDYGGEGGGPDGPPPGNPPAGGAPSGPPPGGGGPGF